MGTGHVATYVFALLATLVVASGCGTDIPSDGYDTSEDCPSDEACRERTSGRLDHCGMLDGMVGMNFCCRAGSIKCTCRDDMSCEGDLVCLEHPVVIGYGAPGPYCQIPALDGPLERVEARRAAALP